MKIGTREVGPGSPVFIIAECGSNHSGSLDAALALIDAAADAGADAAKFQRYRVDSFLVPRENPESLRKYELPDEWLPKLKARCDERGIEFLCTAFDVASLRAVDPFVNAHKIGSYEAADDDYPRDVQKLQKPVFISNGRTGGHWHGERFITLQCVSAYPAPVAAYLKPPLPDSPWGVSDHTASPIVVPIAAVALGACVVEKHLSLGEHQKPTPDSGPWAIWPHHFKAMVLNIRDTESAIRG